MATPNALKQRIEILQMAEAQGKELRPEHKAELEKYRANGLAKGGDAGTGTESERTAAFLATRLGGALRTLSETTAGTPDAAKPGVVQETVRNLAGDTAANFATGEARQRVEAAQLEALDSALTLGTGAAYTREQLEGYRKAYFPMLGDDPATIADKASRLDTVIKAARIKAGSAAASIDEALGPPATINRTETGSNPVEAAAEAFAGPPDPNKAMFSPDGALRVTIGGKPKPPAGPPQGRGTPGFVESMDAVIRGASDTATLGTADEISALANTVIDPNTTLRDNLDRERATDKYDEANNPVARIAGQIGGGFALPMGAARSAAALGAKGAAYGAGYGFGSTEGGAGERFGGALKGGAIGGATGAALGGIGSALASRGNGTGAALGGGPDLAAAAERQGVDIIPADAGGPLTRGMTSLASVLPGSMTTVRNAARRVTQQALGARDRIAAGIGQAVEPEAAGEAAKVGARAFITRTSKVGTGAYDRAEQLAAGAAIDPKNARAVLDRNIAELSQVPGGTDGLDALKALRSELDGQFTVAGIRGMRSALRDRFSKDGLRGSDIERRVNMVIEAANDDVVAGLNAQGNAKAAKAYAVADRYWRNRLRVIDETIAPIVGANNEKSGEQVLAAINGAAKGNAARLGSFVRSLPAEEAATVRATFISQLGRASAGTQDAAGGAFSLPQFLTHWNQMTPGAKRVLFDDASRSALDDLAKIADGAKQAQRYQNFSNTGLSVGGIATGLTGTMGLASLGKTLAAEYAMGKLLASPRFARWLAKAPGQNPADAVQALSVLATREPAIAQEVLGLQARLLRAVGSPQPIAAEEPDNARQIPPQRQ